ncbi:MAG: 50S ribosomal protein L3 [Candidatus Levybacteria bacterium]|nr:50S ribosomal protein L3 [Candidatus Levybacteria bacterium]
MINAIFGIKQSQTQKFLADGTRVPITEIVVSGSPVVSIKNKDKNGYHAVLLGVGGIKKNPNKAILGLLKGANLKNAPRFLREVRMDEENPQLPATGDVINASDIFKPGDIIDVTGVSKGKGFAGVVKRHHFKGGPRTHGQSDRERAPGSIGQTTTPGRVYKGKRMAGRMGHEKVTVKNLKVIDVLEDKLLIKGLVPGGKNTLIEIKKVGEDKKFVPLFSEPAPKEKTVQDEKQAKETKEQVKEEVKIEVKEVKEEENAGK